MELVYAWIVARKRPNTVVAVHLKIFSYPGGRGDTFWGRCVYLILPKNCVYTPKTFVLLSWFILRSRYLYCHKVVFLNREMFTIVTGPGKERFDRDSYEKEGYNPRLYDKRVDAACPWGLSSPR